MSSIFACDLGLNRKTLSRNFFCCFVFHFREIFFNQHWRQMRASLILLFGKTKAFFGKDTARKKTAFLHTLFVENERETSRLKWGAMFFYKVEGHMPKLSSFGRGKKFRPKKSLTSLLHAALQLITVQSFRKISLQILFRWNHLNVNRVKSKMLKIFVVNKITETKLMIQKLLQSI